MHNQRPDIYVFMLMEKLMSIRSVILLAVVGMSLTGCAVMERNHFPQTQDKVPVTAVLAFSEKRPNDEIKEIYEQNMYDGSVHYLFISTDKDKKPVETCIAADGTPIN